MNNRLQKKCVIAAAGLHLLLLAVLFFGSGFLASRETPELPLLEFVPMITTDANVTPRGGNPHAKPPPSTPAPPQPKPEPAPVQPRVERTETPKEPVRREKADPHSLETKSDKKPHKPQVSLRPVVRNHSSSRKPTTSTAEEDAKAREVAQHRASLARSLRENLSGDTEVEMPGPGGGGPTYANYKQVVGSIYFHAWIVPDDVNANAATAVASVTIAKDGTVISASLTKSSGNRSVDRSVQATLDRVRFIAPFPEGSKDSQRTFTINFNLKAKKAIG